MDKLILVLLFRLIRKLFATYRVLANTYNPNVRLNKQIEIFFKVETHAFIVYTVVIIWEKAPFLETNQKTAKWVLQKTWFW